MRKKQKKSAKKRAKSCPFEVSEMNRMTSDSFSKSKSIIVVACSIKTQTQTALKKIS